MEKSDAEPDHKVQTQQEDVETPLSFVVFVARKEEVEFVDVSAIVKKRVGAQHVFGAVHQKDDKHQEVESRHDKAQSAVGGSKPSFAQVDGSEHKGLEVNEEIPHD